MMPATERILLGIDPGTTVMGYGVVIQQQRALKVVQYGVIRLHQYKSQALKLQKIFARVSELICDFHPDEIALEAPFYGKNVQAMLKLGRAQGVAMAAALAKEIPVTEYAPRKIKQAVTGRGGASKEQVARMLITLLQLQDMPELFDASDALAVAVCHAHQEAERPRPTSWKKFVNNHPERTIG